MIIDGKKVAQEIIEKLKSQSAPKKILAAVLVGNAPDSESFLKKKEEIAKELGVDFRLYRFDEKIKNDELRGKVGKLANQKSVGGVIIQLPLPEHLSKHYILNAIPREKDIDILGERALGAFYNGRNPVLPPAVGVIEEILNSKSYILNSVKVAVIGRGLLVGKPVSVWFQNKVAEFSVFNSQTENLRGKLKNFDIIISGVGKANLFSGEDVKENTLVIDFGYDFKDGKIFGDFNPKNADSISYTPTPGGTGPILVAKLLENFYELNKKK